VPSAWQVFPEPQLLPLHGAVHLWPGVGSHEQGSGAISWHTWLTAHGMLVLQSWGF
jgi:hypothetical protein